MLPPMAQLEPGPYLYFDVISDEPTPVQLRLVDKHTLGAFFDGRDDYDLVEEVSRRLVRDEKRQERRS